MKALHQLIKGPIITEKTHQLRAAANQVSLRVDIKANKVEIRKALEQLFKVKVLAVNTVRMRGKKKRMGRTQGVKADWKKAIVTLAPGEKIPGFDGM
jgi:large subunit ribosomal protein L23